MTKVVPFLIASPALRGVVATVRPADALERLTRLTDVEIDDHSHMQPFDPRDLGKDHGPELARSD